MKDGFKGGRRKRRSGAAWRDQIQWKTKSRKAWELDDGGELVKMEKNNRLTISHEASWKLSALMSCLLWMLLSFEWRILFLEGRWGISGRKTMKNWERTEENNRQNHEPALDATVVWVEDERSLEDRRLRIGKKPKRITDRTKSLLGTLCLMSCLLWMQLSFEWKMRDLWKIDDEGLGKNGRE